MDNNVQLDGKSNPNKFSKQNGTVNNGIKKLFEIFITFFKIGAFTFGGGYAMIPLIEREVVNNKGWVSSTEIIDYFAICESIPGAIAINSATLIGYKIAGRKGALAAAAGVILPSFLTITIIATFFTKFQDNPIVKAAFSGVRAAVTALIALAAVKIGRASIKDITGLVIALLAVILVAFLNIHAIFVIIGGALFGLAMYVFSPKRIKHILNANENKNRSNNASNKTSNNSSGNSSINTCDNSSNNTNEKAENKGGK